VTEPLFRMTIIAVALGFSVFFAVVVIPPLVENPDVLGAFAAGFANPFSSGYSADVIACWLVLGAWVLYEARSRSVKGGWICLVVGVIPGVAVGFAAYLILRSRQTESMEGIPSPPAAA